MTEFDEDREEIVDFENEELKAGHEEPDGIPEGAPESELATLLQQLEGGSSWFYWIAALSVVNSLIMFFGGDLSFIVGLGITQIFDGIAAEIAKNHAGNLGFLIEGIAFAVTLATAGMFIFFGVFAKKRHIWAFVIGMVFYALDGLLFLLIQDWFSIGFHVFAFYCIFGGLRAALKLNDLKATAAYQED